MIIVSQSEYLILVMISVPLLTLLLTATPYLCQAGNLTLYAVAVGQGDGNIIQCPNGQDIVIVDMGTIKPYVQPAYITDLLKNKFNAVSSGKRIHIVVTHPHVDHYNFIYRAMDKQLMPNIQEIILGEKFSSYNTNFKTWLEQNFPTSTYTINNGNECFGNSYCKLTPFSGYGKKQAYESASDPWQFCGDEVEIKVLAANLGSSNNSHSVILRLAYNQWSLFLSGDFEMAIPQKRLIKQYKEQLQSTYYKLAHHGAWSASKQPNLPALLKMIQPKRVYMSQAYPNLSSYRHPACTTISHLMNIGSLDTNENSFNSPSVCWNHATNSAKQYNNRMGLAIYQTCPRYSSGRQVCHDVWVESDGKHDNTRYVRVPSQYVVKKKRFGKRGQ